MGRPKLSDDDPLVCLYCLETKPRRNFDKEHVLPKGFGKYQGNLTLVGIVCKACNGFFANNLDNILGRDSGEGLQRYLLGLKTLDVGRRMGRTKRLRVHLPEGTPYAGAILEWVAPTIGSAGAELMIVPQCGFRKALAENYTWCALEDLPTRQDFLDRGYSKEMYIRVWGCELAQAQEALEAKGFNGTFAADQEPARVMFEPYSAVTTSVTVVFDDMHARAVAKVAMNYLAYHYPDIARMPQTAAARRFIRFGEGEAEDFVKVVPGGAIGNAPRNAQVLLHVVAAAWSARYRCISGQVSFFDWTKYAINLGSGFIIDPDCVASGHAFNPFTLKIAQMTAQNQPALDLTKMTRLKR